jgi:Tol biopolymer transport system component
LTIDDAMSGEIVAYLEPVRFVRTRLQRWEFSGQGVSIGQEVVLAEVGEIETEPQVRAVTSVTNLPPGEFVLTRISLAPDGEQVLYSKPFSLTDADDICSNLWAQRGQGTTRLTDGPKVDLDATVSSDGQYIYFSANRLKPGKLNLWRMRAVGQGGLTKITDSPSSIADTEPSVSPDGQSIAFTSLLRDSVAPQIWIARADGTLPTQIRVGRSPAWSPDGNRLAYVAPDDAGFNQIWVMNSDGSHPTQLTDGSHSNEYPTWTPDGFRLVYASDEAINVEGEANFDIWIMNDDGTSRTQLTVNGSYDTRPVVTYDGRFIYFISNRGARREFDDNWQIWRIELAERAS